MKILVSNDDGIQAEGLWILAKELQKIGEVTIVAPDRDQSGVGTAITLRQPLRLRRVASRINRVKAYSVEGTPGDSVILGLRHAVKDDVDLVVAGINEGPNLGNDVFISGTVGAALQGYFYGIPSIAMSVAAFESLDYSVAANLAFLLAAEVKAGKLPRKMMLNVNLPNLPLEKIEGIDVTKLGDRNYVDRIDQGHDGKKEYYWIIRGLPQWNVINGTDVWTLEQNRISINIYPDTADTVLQDSLQKLIPELFSRLHEETKI